MAPTPEARGVVEIWRKASGETSSVGVPDRRRSRIEPAGDGDDEELFAVEERLDAEAALDGLDDVPHALDEEHPPGIAVCAIGLEASDLIERGLGDRARSDQGGFHSAFSLMRSPGLGMREIGRLTTADERSQGQPPLR